MQQYDFIGREKELARLDKMYDSRTQEATLIYGRRRVGKSELIKQFVQQHVDKAIYFECKQTTELNNVATLGELVSDKMQLPPLGFTNIEQLLDFVFKQA